MSYETLKVETVGNVGIVRLSVPETLNAVTYRMMDELNAAFNRLENEARAIVLTGEGRAFSSGWAFSGDAMNAEEQRSFDAGDVLETHINPFMNRLRGLDVPMVSAVNGIAAGVGCSFAFAADLCIAASGASFLQAFSKVGLVPDGGSSYMLVRTIGRVRAMELALLARPLEAAKAAEWGLVNDVVAPEALLDQAVEIAGKLAAGPAALKMTRNMLWAALDAPWDEALTSERQKQKAAGRTRDFIEGVSAFREKRKPEFSGE